ncbi:MAG: hypothetical protein AAGE52_41825 [Myxococcota bacterium]
MKPYIEEVTRLREQIRRLHEKNETLARENQELREETRLRLNLPTTSQQADRARKVALSLGEAASELESLADELPAVFEYRLLRQRIAKLEATITELRRESGGKS